MKILFLQKLSQNPPFSLGCADFLLLDIFVDAFSSNRVRRFGLQPLSSGKQNTNADHKIFGKLGFLGRTPSKSAASPAAPRPPIYLPLQCGTWESFALSPNLEQGSRWRIYTTTGAFGSALTAWFSHISCKHLTSVKPSVRSPVW